MGGQGDPAEEAHPPTLLLLLASFSPLYPKPREARVLAYNSFSRINQPAEYTQPIEPIEQSDQPIKAAGLKAIQLNRPSL